MSTAATDSSCDIFASLQADTVCVSWRFERTFAFDLEGRMVSAFRDGVSYTRGLSGRLQARWRARSGASRARARLDLSDDAQTRLLDEAGSLVTQAHRLALSAPSRIRVTAQGHAQTSRIDAFVDWVDDRRIRTALDHRTDAARWRAVVPGVGILPPDQYRALVVQPVRGCPYNRCGFCTFYKGTPFQVRRLDDVAHQVDLLKAHLGRGLRRYRSIFLGDANPFVVDASRLARMLAQIHERLGLREGATPARWPVAGFIDVFGMRPASPEGFRPLVEQGLRRVYVGLESGSPEVLELLGKPGTRRQALDLVADLRGAGLSVGLIVLLGAGGRALAGEHLAATLDLLSALSPGERDIVYVSPLVVSPGSAYDSCTYSRGIEPLTDTEMQEQALRIKSALDLGRPGRARFALYDVRDFVF